MPLLNCPDAFYKIPKFVEGASVPENAEPRMQIKFLWVGKTRNPDLKNLCEGYLARSRRLARCEIVELPDGSRKRGSAPAPVRLAEEAAEIGRHIPSQGRLVVLDAEGREFGSEEFASWLQKERNRGTRELRFVLGGPDGIVPGLLRQADLRLSMGRMTWPHEIARVLLLEQVYRALSLLAGLPYHR